MDKKSALGTLLTVTVSLSICGGITFLKFQPTIEVTPKTQKVTENEFASEPTEKPIEPTEESTESTEDP